MKQFLVEVFVPGSDVDEFAAAERRVREAAERVSRRGTAVRYVRTTYLPEDETCFHVFESASPDAVSRVSALAGLSDGRILEARTTEGRG